MRKWMLPALVLVAGMALFSGCSRSTGGGEAHYLSLFSGVWQKCHALGLYEASVEAMTEMPDGNKQVVVRYLYDTGMTPATGRAALLVSPQGRLASDCVLDLDINICMCGADKDWQAAPLEQ